MTTPRTQELTPLLPEDIERLRLEYQKLPVHDPRARLLASYDKLKMEAEALRRVLVDVNRENRQMRAEIAEKDA